MSDRDRLADWLLSTEGRVTRIVLGTLVILVGLALVGGFLGVLLLLIGAVPIASAAYGTLLVGPLLGRDIHGRRPEDQPAEQTDGDGDSADEDDSGDDEPRSEERDEERSGSGEEERSGSGEEDRSGSGEEERSGSGEEERSGSGDEDRSGSGDGPRKEPDEEWSAPPLARAERPPGQEARTKDLRSDEPGGESQG